MKKLLLAGLLITVVAGCKSNPYEDKPKVEPIKKVVPTPTPSPTPDPTATPQPTATPAPTPTPTPTPVYSLEAPGVMRFKEGQRTSYIIRGSVPAPGVAQITFTGLQAGMSYNAAEEKLYWTAPNGDAGRTFVVEVRLRSSLDPVTALVKESVGVVESALAPAIALAKVDGDSQNVQLQYTAVGGDTPNWMIHGAKPGEIQFVTTKFPSLDGFAGKLLSMNWKVDPLTWQDSTRDIKIIACSSDGTACDAQEVKLKYDPLNGMQLIPHSGVSIGIGR